MSPPHVGLCHAYFELGEKRKAMEVALKGLKRFPEGDPILYQNVGATFLDMGWKEEAREVLREGLEKFSADEDPENSFRDLNEDMDDPDWWHKAPAPGAHASYGTHLQEDKGQEETLT